MKLAVETSQTRDVEYWSGWVTEARYYEDWDERVPCTHEKYSTDADGNRIYQGYEHPYDVRYHGAYWELTDSNGLVVNIRSNEFEALCKKFNNREFKDLRRSYHTNDGDMYYTRPNKGLAVPIVTKHYYKNRIQASDSIMNFPDVRDTTGLYEYPKYSYQLYFKEDALASLNAGLGAKKQVHVWLLTFTGEVDDAIRQQHYWKNGNKNELVICIGPNWVYVFCWGNETLKASIESKFLSGVDLDWLAQEVDKHWSRVSFAQFSYLTVQPPLWGVILTWIVTLFATIGTNFWIIKNDVN